jgi:RNA polymerase sigma-70 factor (ECF subfamily)
MISNPDDFRTLLDAVMARQPGAAEQFCQTYQSHILRVVRRRLLKQMRLRYDSIDFVQDVWASFFAEPPRDVHFDDPQALIGYLERMAQFKVGQRLRQQTGTHKYNVFREQQIDSDGIDPDRHLRDPHPTPSQEYYAREQWERMLDGLPPQHQRIVRMLHQGMTYSEIAEQLQTTEKTIQRLVRRLEHKVSDA